MSQLPHSGAPEAPEDDHEAGRAGSDTGERRTFVKRRGAGEGDRYPESWGEADVSRSINVADAHRQDGGPALVAGPSAGPPSATFGPGGDVTHTLTAEGHDASEDGTGRGAPIIETAATLTRGSSGPGASAPGRRQEDDVNIVPAVAATLKGGQEQGGRRGDVEATYVADTVRSHARPGSNSATLAEVAEVAEVAEGQACGHDPLPDGRRYAACGDGVASPVAHWIGRRLLAVMRGEDPDA